MPGRAETAMIQLTRLNNNPLAVNSDLIKFVEQAPDTVITLVTGEKLVVRETAPQIIELITEFRRRVLQGVTPWWDNRASLPAIVENRKQPDSEK
jgi:uncharacterized protein YlzI (FlbEa/FlbD family)